MRGGRALSALAILLCMRAACAISSWRLPCAAGRAIFYVQVGRPDAAATVPVAALRRLLHGCRGAAVPAPGNFLY